MQNNDVMLLRETVSANDNKGVEGENMAELDNLKRQKRSNVAYFHKIWHQRPDVPHLQRMQGGNTSNMPKHLSMRSIKYQESHHSIADI